MDIKSVRPEQYHPNGSLVAEQIKSEKEEAKHERIPVKHTFTEWTDIKSVRHEKHPCC